MTTPQDSLRIAPQHLHDMTETLREHLRLIKDTLNPPGSLFDTQIWDLTKSKPNLNWVHGALLNFQETLPQESCAEPATWENLDNWMNECHLMLVKQIERDTMIFNDLGVESQEQLLNHAFIRQLKRDLGPQWQASLEGIRRVTGTTKSKRQISAAAMEKSFHLRAEKIFKHWRSLQQMEESKKVERFITEWSRMSQSARRDFLLAKFDHLHESSDPYVHQVANSPASKWQSIASKHFTAPLLNIPELIEGQNLPNFIKSRVFRHPRLFREIDGNGIIAGLFCGSLAELSCERQLMIVHTSENYEIRWLEHLQVSSINPALYFHQLEAQSKTYGFLDDCVDGLDSTPNPLSVGQHPDAEPGLEQPSLLEKMAQIDYSEPQQIDLLYIQTLIQCSLNDAFNDLRELRADPELFNTRMNSTPQVRRCETFLKDTFDRIDYFSRLLPRVDELVEEDRANLRLESATIDDLKDYVALEVALKDVLSSIVSTLDIGRWSRRLSSGTLVGLITLLVEKHAIIWAIGHGRVLKVIQRELLDRENRKEVPIRTMHAFNDMSIIAYCLRETQKYRRFVPLGKELEHANLIESCILHLEGSPCLWQSLASDTISLMGEQTKQKLKVLNIRETLKPLERHNQFWLTVDPLMEAASKGKDTQKVYDMVQLYTPLSPSFHDQEAEAALHELAESSPTQTQLRKGKGRRPGVQRSLPRSAAKSSERTPLPRLRLSINQALRQDVFRFWNDLCDPETKRTFRWNDFCTAMTAIGYSRTAQGGSGYRFEDSQKEKSHAIVFHRPHDDKLPPNIARRFLHRMQVHVDLQISS